LWMHRHGCVLQKAALDYLPGEYAVSPRNKPTVSFTDTTHQEKGAT
jgi:hypothetical protein